MAPTVELLLLRHAIAEERRADRPDRARPLTAWGRSRGRAVVDRLAALDLRADRLLSSPLTRARQTAELAVAAGLAPALELADGLAPEADPLPLLEIWRAGQDGKKEAQRPLRLLLVGHEPDLGLLASRLIGAPPGAVRLRKAGVVLLRLPADSSRPLLGGVSLRLLMTPRMLLSAASATAPSEPGP